MALLEVLGVLIDSSPCQQHMSVPSDSLPWQLGRIAPHHIDILGYNPQWNVLPPNIPHIVPHHHWEHRSGSFLIPCWSFWGLIPDLHFDWTMSHVLKCCVKRGLKEVHDCWRIIYGVRFQCQRKEEGVWLVDEVDMASGHHCVVCHWRFVMRSSIRCCSAWCCSIWCSRSFKDCNRKR